MRKIRSKFLSKQSKLEIPKLKRKLTKLFNAFIRKRDERLQSGICISCNKRGNQAGHYLPTSLCPHPSMVFNEKNVNLQCSHCNRWLHGNQHDYAIRLNKKYGYDVVSELEMQRKFKSEPWGKFQYEVMIKHYEQKLKEES